MPPPPPVAGVPAGGESGSTRSGPSVAACSSSGCGLDARASASPGATSGRRPVPDVRLTGAWAMASGTRSSSESSDWAADEASHVRPQLLLTPLDHSVPTPRGSQAMAPPSGTSSSAATSLGA